MSHRLVVALATFAALALAPSLAHAQATLAGVVRDASGAAVPGVTVEASSPALIEKVRTAVTDNSGQYRIVDLIPGTYTVTFTLSGFAAVRREGVELSGVAVRSVDADLKVGNVTEAIVVTGETPTVDVQSVRREAVIDNAIINSLPVARGYGDVTLAIPTLQGGPLNSSVNSLSVLPNFFTIHGGRGNEGNIQIDGMNVGAAFNGAGVSGNAYDIANAREMQLTLTGRPRRGGNRRARVEPRVGRRREPVRRHALHQQRGRVVAGRQYRRRTARLWHHRAGGAPQVVGCQRVHRRPDQARQALVLLQLPRLREPHRHSRPVCQRELPAIRTALSTRPTPRSRLAARPRRPWLWAV